MSLPAPRPAPLAPDRLSPDLVGEALLYLEWSRGAGGRYLSAETAAPVPTSGTPSSGTPTSGTPTSGTPTSGTPTSGTPTSGTPTSGVATSGVPSLRVPAGLAPAPRVSPAGPGGSVRLVAGPTPGLTSLSRETAAGRADPARWGPLEAEVAGCQRCGLCATRTQTVFGAGSRLPRLVVIGEAPGAEEDLQGQPFVGAAGELLTRMLAAIGLGREHDVYIANVLKCRPPDNRPPRPEEVAACKPYLREQLELMGPPLLLALGNAACRALLGTERGISSLRGRFTTTPEGWRVMPTFHPAYLLRTPEAKREVWSDLKLVAQELGLR